MEKKKKKKLGWGLPAADTARVGTALGLTSSLPSLQGASLIQGGPRIKCESTPPPRVPPSSLQSLRKPPFS